MKTSGVIYTSRLMRCEVKNVEAETIGKLVELVIDAELGRTAYGVVKSGGGFLKSDKLFAVPWQAFELSEDESGLVLNADKTLLQNAAAFDKDRWPDMSDRRWGASVHAFFETTPYWEVRSPGPSDRIEAPERDGQEQERQETPIIL